MIKGADLLRTGIVLGVKPVSYTPLYAYEIHVSKSWNKEEVVYEEVVDSYSMDLNTFRAQLNRCV